MSHDVNNVNICDRVTDVSHKPYHHGSLEQALVDTALAVVRELGIDALSMRDLARTIDVSPSATYRHFPSRDHLVMRVSQCSREALARSLMAARDGIIGSNTKRRSVERFEAIGRAYVQFAISNPNVFEAAFTRSEVALERPDDPSAWSVLVDSIEQMISAGAVPPARRKDAPMIAWSGVHGISTILTSSIWPAGVNADHEVEAVISGILRSLR